MLFKAIKASTATYDYLLVGLGNPGAKYEQTRHNAGFMTADKLAADVGFKINKLKWSSLYGECTLGSFRCLVMKPQTFMNNSGEAVRECAQFYKIPVENIIVVYDDISLDVGKLRVRRKGSDGGHNGIKSLIQHLGSDQFPRIKIGVGKKPHPEYDLAAWVLSRFTPTELKALTPAIDNATQCIRLAVQGQLEEAMCQFNS